MSFFKRSTSTLPTPTGAAIDLDTMRHRAPDLVNLYKTAAVSLTKASLNTQRAAVHLVLDHSGSMTNLYASGAVQHLTEQTLALAANLDDDGTVPVTFFHDRAYEPMDAVIGSHQGVVDRMRRQAGVTWGGTNYAPAMQRVIDEHQQGGTNLATFVIFQTDGKCNDRAATEKLLRDSSRLPIFWQFLGFGDHGSGEFEFLRGLDTLAGRAVDNAGFCATGRNPKNLCDQHLYDLLLNEYPTWLIAARNAGVIS